ncbi:MAG: hypothetical protein ABL997_14400 [Planctomycetota bacterium]
MGLFDWMFGRRTRLPRTTVWIDEASRLRGLERAVRDDLASGRSVVLVAHFASALVEVGKQLAEADIAFRTLRAWQPLPASPTVVAILAKALPQPTPGEPPKVVARGKPQVIVRGVELHVLEQENARLLQFADGLSVPTEVSCSVSLEGPLFAMVGNQWLAPMLQSMGMGSDESIDSPMVARSLAKVQRKLEKRARRDLPADSLAEWILRNVDPK